MPARDSLPSEASASPDLDDARGSPELVGPERHARETLGVPGALPARGMMLRVDVIEASGRPASGVAIACGIFSSPGVFDACLRTRSDAQGSAWIELSRLPDPSASAWTDGSLRLRGEILASPVPELALDPSVAAAKEVVLRLPPTGSVRLEVVDALGRAAQNAAHFAVWARAADAARNLEMLPRRVAASSGVAVLEHVGLGLELRVAATLDDDEAEAERVEASGPRFDGEERTISVPLGPEWPTVRLRARDERGNVLRNETLVAEVRWTRPGASPSSEVSLPRDVRTDDEGRARFPLRGTVAGGFTRRLVLTRSDKGAAATAGGILRSAERDLSWDVEAGGEIDLGDVELRPLEPEPDSVLWVSGSVADHAGSPVRSATVLVSAVDAEGARLPGSAAHVTVEPDGTFAVTGPPLEHRLSVRAVAPGFSLSAEEVVVPGARGLRIRMQAAARWAGRLLLDAGIPPESLAVAVTSPGRTQRTIPTSERITVEGLEAGPVDVEVRTRAGDWLVQRWEQLPSTPAGQPMEARVDELDLRGRLTRLRLRLVDSDGSALERVFAHVRPEPFPEGGEWIRAGRLELVVPSEARSITVQPRGYPPVAVWMLDEIQELTCGPRIAGGSIDPHARGSDLPRAASDDAKRLQRH